MNVIRMSRFPKVLIIHNRLKRFVVLVDEYYKNVNILKSIIANHRKREKAY